MQWVERGEGIGSRGGGDRARRRGIGEGTGRVSSCEGPRFNPLVEEQPVVGMEMQGARLGQGSGSGDMRRKQ